MRRPATLSLLAVLSLAGPAAAQVPHTVSGVTVVPAGDPPKLVSSYPAAGAVVAPGVLVLRLTFDQKMSPDAWDVTAAPGRQAPGCLKTPRLLNDGKTFVLLCTLGPNSAYAVALNASASGGFQNLGEKRAAATSLSFSTNDADNGPISVAEAMKSASLTSLDLPIEASPGKIGDLGR